LTTSRTNNPNHSEEQFLKYMKEGISCAQELVAYQSPTYKAIQVQDYAAMMPRDEIKTNDEAEESVIDMKDPNVVARIYRRIMTADD
jgi:hypothetical protein